MLCTECGAEAAAKSRFCSQCGASTAGAEPSDTSASSPDAAVRAQTTASQQSARKTDIKAVLSMALGALSILLSVFAGVPAVILGHMSRSSVRRSAGKLKGEGMALAGLTMGYISMFIFPVIAGIVVVVIPMAFRTAIVANEASAMKTIRIINVAAAGYQVEHDLYPASLQELDANALVALDSQLMTQGVQNGYEFAYKSTAGQKGYVIKADPAFIHTGQRHFYSDATGIIRYEKDHPANSNSPVVEAGP